jgi:predicted TIM-barrel fold metal-dependent hydrolase
MDGISYFDCLASIGKSGPKDELTPWTKDVLLDEMIHCGINAALVEHNVAREYDPVFGNNKLMTKLKAEQRLLPIWVVMPHQTDEMPPGPELVEQMMANDVRAARMYPKSQNYALNDATCGVLLGALEGEGILLSIDFNQATPEQLTDMCLAHPDLPVLITGASWAQTRFLYPVLDQCPNTHIEFSTFQANYAIERLGDRYGFERLLFGTGALMKSPGAAKSFIDYADIPDVERAKVAGGNLARLLHLQQMPGAWRPDIKPEHEVRGRRVFPTQAFRESGSSGILRRVKEGKPLDDITIIDAHTHMVHDGGQGVGYIPMPQGDADNMVARNRRMGIDKFMTSSWVGIWADCEDGNRVVRRAIERYPDDVIGYATLDPNYLDEKEFDRWLRVAYEEWGFKGMKPYNPRVAIPYNSERYDRWYKYGNEHRLICLLHSSGGNFLNEVSDISERYPDISFLLAHTGGDFQTARERLPLARERDNVFLEITLTPVTYGVIEYMVNEVGAEKVVFGTDAPMRDPIPQFGWMCYSRCSDAELRLMLGENTERLLARVR